MSLWVIKHHAVEMYGEWGRENLLRCLCYKRDYPVIWTLLLHHTDCDLPQISETNASFWMILQKYVKNILYSFPKGLKHLLI